MRRHSDVSEYVCLSLAVFLPRFLAAVDHLMLPSHFDRFISARPSSFTLFPWQPHPTLDHWHQLQFLCGLFDYSANFQRALRHMSLIISVHITSVCITRVWWIIWKCWSCHGSFALFILIERLFCSARIALVRLILVSVSHPMLKPNHIVRRSWKTQWNIPVKVEEM